MGKGRRVRASRSTGTRRSVEPHAVGLGIAPLLPRDVVAHVDERDVGAMTSRHVDALLLTVAPDRHARVAAGLIALGSLLQRKVLVREAMDAVDREIADAVRQLRFDVASWTQVGERLGITRQGARQHFSRRTGGRP